MKANHVCLGVDPERDIPCDSCRDDAFWREYAEREALAQEREAS